jgi:hypothetical protein
MPKVKNRHLIQVEIRGQRANVSQPEYELSPEEWYRRRTDAFAQLRKSGGIPEELLQLIEHFKERNLVELFVYRARKEVALRFGVKALPEKTDEARQLAEMIAIGKRINSEPNKKGMSASEALAFFLRMDLRALKNEERERNAAPVRALKRVPRSLIAEIAMDLLGSCETWGYPPGHFLNSLVRELLNLDQDRQGMSRDVERQELAAAIVAQAPEVGTRQLAKAVHVNASTISRWRRSAEFKKLVEQKLNAFEHSAEAGQKLYKFANKDRLQKQAIALLLATAAQLSSRKNPD